MGESQCPLQPPVALLPPRRGAPRPLVVDNHDSSLNTIESVRPKSDRSVSLRHSLRTLLSPMSHAFFDALAVFRPSEAGFSRELKAQIQIHRLLSLLGAILVPLFGPLYAVANPEAIDPAWARLGIALLFVLLFVASYRAKTLRRHYVEATRVLLYVLMGWFAIVTVINGFAGNYALGLLLVFAVLSVVVGLGVKRTGPVLRFLGFGLLLTASGGLLEPAPKVSLPILILSMATIAIVGSIVIQTQVAIQEELREAKEKAEEANRLKSVMLANMSHELRTPLTSINGFAEILRDNLQGRMRRFAEKIYMSGRRLLATLRSVIDLSRLEAGTFELKQERVDVGPTVVKAVQRFRPEAEENGISLDVTVADGATWAKLDEAAADRITENLLENALKFTPHGGAVNVRVLSQMDEVILEVEDSGIGIEEEAIPQIFDAFRQESEGMDREYEGTGLGLAIVRELAEELGGTVDVESEKGEGSCFIVHLPAAEPGPPPD